MAVRSRNAQRDMSAAQCQSSDKIEQVYLSVFFSIAIHHKYFLRCK